jgi:hypothetical protein
MADIFKMDFFDIRKELIVKMSLKKMAAKLRMVVGSSFSSKIYKTYFKKKIQFILTISKNLMELKKHRKFKMADLFKMARKNFDEPSI